MHIYSKQKYIYSHSKYLVFTLGLYAILRIKSCTVVEQDIFINTQILEYLFI